MIRLNPHPNCCHIAFNATSHRHVSHTQKSHPTLICTLLLVLTESSLSLSLSLPAPLILRYCYCLAMSAHTNIRHGPQLIFLSTHLSLPNEFLRMMQLANAASYTHFDKSTLLHLTLLPSTSHSSQLLRRSIGHYLRTRIPTVLQDPSTTIAMSTTENLTAATTGKMSLDQSYLQNGCLQKLLLEM